MLYESRVLELKYHIVYVLPIPTISDITRDK